MHSGRERSEFTKLIIEGDGRERLRRGFCRFCRLIGVVARNNADGQIVIFFFARGGVVSTSGGCVSG